MNYLWHMYVIYVIPYVRSNKLFFTKNITSNTNIIFVGYKIIFSSYTRTKECTTLDCTEVAKTRLYLQFRNTHNCNSHTIVQ